MIIRSKVIITTSGQSSNTPALGSTHHFIPNTSRQQPISLKQPRKGPERATETPMASGSEKAKPLDEQPA
jgi:hypothetical protein